MMNEQQEIMEALNEALGEQGCGMSCCEAEIFKDGEQWKLLLEGFLEPWPLGRTVEEAKATISEYAGMQFGLS